MAVLQALPHEESLCHSSMPDDVVAADITAPLHSVIKLQTTVNLDEVGQVDYLGGIQDELPPYENVTDDTFFTPLEEMQLCSCRDLTEAYPSRSSSIDGDCSVCASHDNYILFPSNSEISFEESSSIASCFTDDLSRTTQSVRTSTYDLLAKSRLSSSALVEARQEVCCYNGDQTKSRPTSDVAGWLHDLDLHDRCIHHANTFPPNGTNLARVSDPQDVGGEESSGQKHK